MVPQFQHDEDRDGCVCDVKFNQSDALPDSELPPASEGVQAAVETRGDEDRVDGCDVEFNANQLTTDQELPARCCARSRRPWMRPRAFV